MSSQASPSQGGRLTFGVEFEFMVARLRGDQDPHPGDGRWTAPFGTWENSTEDSVCEQAQDFITNLLVENGIPALSEHRALSSDIEYVREQADSQGVQPRPRPGKVATHAFWMVSHEPRMEVIEEDVDGYDHVGLEVSSRILLETNFREVVKVYSLIRNSIRAQVNSSCGLHYHVGIGHFSLESIKKLVTLLMVLEDKGLFRMICAPHRSSPTNRWCKPVSKHSKAVAISDSPARDLPNPSLADHLPQHHQISPALRLPLTRIWNCSTVDGIRRETLIGDTDIGTGQNFGYHRRGSFAVRDNLSESDIEGTHVIGDRTIEFRYKESTGSAEEDHHWLQLCLRLVRAAEWPRDRFRAALRDFSTANTFEGGLYSLGLGGEEVRWWLDIEQRHRQQPSPSKKMEFLAPENLSSSGAA